MMTSEIAKLKELINDAEAVVVGAGAGLSAAAGFEYGGKVFGDNFSDFEAKYGVHDMYSAGFLPFVSECEKWAFWSRAIMLNRYSDPPKRTYEKLLSLILDKEYFIITTNVDHCFQKSGFDKSRLFYTQGDYGLFQCSKPCHNETYDNFEKVSDMVKTQRGMQIPNDLIPKCPKCGAPCSMNLRCDDTFVEDEGWHDACMRYKEFLQGFDNQKVLFLELGVGFNTPGIIKYPFWKMTAENKNAHYICIDINKPYAPQTIAERSLLIKSDIDDMLNQIVDG